MSCHLDESHEPGLVSWVPGADEHPDFPVQNLPLGVFSPVDGERRGGVAIGDWVLDLSCAGASDLLTGDALAGARSGAGQTLNALLGAPAQRRALRRRLSALLCDPDRRSSVEGWLRPLGEVRLHLPAAIGDYTDFYVGIHHAANVGAIFRPENPLLPNYRWVPIGYHGRASSVRPSGESVVRPQGQLKSADADEPVYAPCRRLDFELELGVWIGEGNALGAPIPIDTAGQAIAGLCLLNDWSARDVQAWEYQPLGPFLSKSFHTTVSPWVVTAEALAPFRTQAPPRSPDDPQPLPYLSSERDRAEGGFKIEVEAFLSSAEGRTSGAPAQRIAKTGAASMYWTVAQMIAHHTSGGCNLNPGDLLGTGTLSAQTDDGLGSLLEMTGGGKRPFRLSTGQERLFLQDGDEVVLRATASADGRRSIGFGECRGCVAPPVAAQSAAGAQPMNPG